MTLSLVHKGNQVTEDGIVSSKSVVRSDNGEILCILSENFSGGDVEPRFKFDVSMVTEEVEDGVRTMCVGGVNTVLEGIDLATKISDLCHVSREE